jgi:seryl-tRNA synthetase
MRGTLSNAVRDTQNAAGRVAAITKASEAKERLHAMEQELGIKQGDLYSLASSLPNDTHPLTPIGSESRARIISVHGPPLHPKNTLRDHLNVAKELDMIDMESGATVTGSSWYFLRNGGALLELALINYALASAIKAGFTPVTVPDVVKADIADRCGFEPRDTLASQAYHILNKGQADQHVLAGTAEIPLAGMFALRAIREKDLPILVAGIGRAFRAEAGARGADTRGLYRVHQFSKVELFAVASEEDSDSMLDRLVDLQKLIFDGLNLPFR